MRFKNTMFRRAVIAGLPATALLGLMGVGLRAQTTPVIKGQTALLRPKGTLTYSKDIAPILYKNCASCHRPDEVGPFSLLSYADAKRRAAQIALVAEKRVMPPWRLDSHGEFQDERRLTEAQIATIKQWAAEGAKEGRQSDLPPAPQFAPGWTLGQPDMVVKSAAPYHLAAEGRDVYRCFVIPTHFTEDRYVSALDVRPGNRAVVHHVIAYINTTGAARKLDGKETEPGYSTGGGVGFLPEGMLGGWAPGARPVRLPDETGILLPRGADIVLEVHYHKDGKPETDLSQVALYFNKQPIERPYHLLPLLNAGIRIPAGDKDHVERAEITVPMDARLYTVFPHMHVLGRQMTVVATLPDGTKKSLVQVPDWDFNWQGFYAYKEPIKLPQGAKIELVAHYDNSTGNPRNPNNPPKDVRWGEQTTDEMCLCYLGFTLDAETATQKVPLRRLKHTAFISQPAEQQGTLPIGILLASAKRDATGIPPVSAKGDGTGGPFAAAKGKKAVVLFFLGTDCPISNAYAPEIKRICDRYAPQKVAFDLVYPAPGLSLADAKKHAKEYGYTAPVLLDPDHRLTRRAGATVTPQAVVFAPNGKLLYRGRIDDLYVDFGKQRYQATQHDLRAALDAVVQGKPVPQRFTRSIGCFIPQGK